MEGMAYQWLFALVGGIVVLGLVIAYAMKRSSKTTAREDMSAEMGAKRIYKAEDEKRDIAPH